jgi:hypothetical protein
MTDELFPCGHCGGNWAFGWSQRALARPSAPQLDFSKIGTGAGRALIMDDLERRPPTEPPTETVVCIVCSDCGMQTPWVPVGDDKHAALDEAGKIWNTRLNRPVATKGDILDLIRKEISAVDVPYIIDLLARSSDCWEERGPIFAMLAQKVVDSKITMRDFWPIDPVLTDAARYRKLVQLAKFVYIDAIESVQFPRIPATGGEEERSFEDRIASAVDDLPDRSRW